MPTNPYNTEGISDEDRGLIAVIEWAGGIPTSTTDHPVWTASNHLSRHRLPGTNGEGLAVDGTTLAPPIGLRKLYDRIVGEFHPFLHEAICGQAPERIKNGRAVLWTDSEADRKLRFAHMGHCHFSVDRGVILTPPEQEGDDEMPTDKQKMDACPCWVTGCPGAFSVEYDGGVQSVGDHTGGIVPEDHFRGSYFSLPAEARNDPARRFYSIVSVAGQGYLILGTDGTFYGPDLRS